jgi:hypothetical protein
MAASYPSSVKTWTDKTDHVDDVFATHINDAYAEIIAIETELTANKAKIGSASDTLLTTTSQTTILTLTPPAQGNYKVGIYFRVVTGTTNVTVVVTYTDGTGAQTNTLLSAQSCPVGSYSTLPLFVNAKSTGAISVKVTASVASRVYASASIEIEGVL